MKRKPPGQPRWDYVDVDGTLITRHGVAQALIEKIRGLRAGGWVIVVWSSRGSVYARAAVEKAGLTDQVDHILSKPGLMLDDQGLEKRPGPFEVAVRWITHSR